MARRITITTENGKHYTIEIEGGNIHVYKPGWVGRVGLGENFSDIEDALEAIKEDSGSDIEDFEDDD